MTTKMKVWFAAAALIPALMACSNAEPPAPEIPKPAKVKAFTASAAQVAAAGESVSLSWELEDATAVTLTTLAGAHIALPDGAVNSGTVEVTVEASTVYVLTANGEGGSDSAAVSVEVPTYEAPIVFTAFPTEVKAGEEVTLVWNAPYAATVSVSTSDGVEVYAGAEKNGSLTVRPRFDTTWTLVADGAQQQASVKVTPAVLTFETSAANVELGGSVTLAWQAGGSSRVTLSAVGYGELAQFTERADIAEGSFIHPIPDDVIANGQVTYVLEASENGVVARRELTVWVGAQPTFEALQIPDFAREGGSFTIGWKARHADQLEVLVDGRVVHQASNAAELAEGTLMLDSPPAQGSFEVAVRLINARGGITVGRHTVAAVGLPSVVDFSASTALVGQGGEPITLSWDVPNARFVRVSIVGGRILKEVTGTAAEAGTLVVYPNGPTTYELAADNRVGDSLSANPTVQVDVTTPANLTFTPEPVPAGAPVQVTGHTVLNGGTILGLPNVVKNAPGEAFIDISQTGEKVNFFDGMDEWPELVTLPTSFSGPVYGRSGVHTQVSIAVDGWFVLANEPQWGTPDNTGAWPGTELVPTAIAPYFENLITKPNAESAVYYQLDGTGLDERLIVQWTNMQYIDDLNSSVTFQAQVYGSGRIVFAYRTLSGVPGTPSVGVIDRHETGGLVPADLPAEGDTYTFFGPMMLPVTIPASPDPYAVRVEMGNSDFIEVEAVPSLIPPGQFVISEVSSDPQWFEVENRTSSAIDLAGWELVIDGAVHALNGSVVLPANDRLVFAPTTNVAAGVTVDYAYGTSFSIPAGASIGLKRLGGVYTAMTLPAASLPTGTSWHVGTIPAGMTAAAGVTELECLASSSSTYGSGYQGTPGAANTPCPNFTLAGSIPGNFEPIADTKVEFDWGTNEDLTVVNLTAPIYVDGAAYTQITVGTNGYISLDPNLQCDYNSWPPCYGDNEITPDPNFGANGLIAPFWDNLDEGVGGGVYVKRIDPTNGLNNGYTIVSWQHVTRAWNSDDLNFQVKFFDTGVIEFHFGDMIGTDGSFATTWLEHSSGAAAWVINADSPGITSNTAYRFMPQ